MEEKEKWHGAHHYSDKVHFGVVLFLFFGLILLLASYFILNGDRLNSKQGSSPTVPAAPEEKSPEDDLIVCTQDAKMCPDGSFVGRVSPNCEFAACPE